MPLPPHLQAKACVIQAWKAGVASVGGERVTRAALGGEGVEPIAHLLAVGKAAASMCAGALDRLAGDGRALVVTKYGHGDDAVAGHPQITVIESGHPLPDENSLRAGRAVEQFVRAVPSGERLVMLVSGGASALAEAPPDGVTLETLREVNRELLAGGCGIEQINVARARFSAIKGGKLLAGFGGRSVHVYAISDVPGDRVDLIGGGIGSLHPPPPTAGPLPSGVEDFIRRFGLAPRDAAPAGRFAYHASVIGSNRVAREGAARFLVGRGIPVIVNREALHRDVHAAARLIAGDLLGGPPGAYIWGGEPTVVLPPKPGVGGRSQSLALAVAGEIRGRGNITVLAAGTDGTDGPTAVAGALVDGDTFNAAPGAAAALHKANAGTCLARIAALFKPGPTGTNVMDLAVAIKE